MRRRDYITATIAGTTGVVIAGCSSGRDDSGGTNTPEQGPEQDIQFIRKVGETARFQNGVEVTIEQHTTTAEFRQRKSDRRETDEYRFDTKVSEPRSTFILLEFHIRNTGETEESLLPSMDLLYKNELADFLNFDSGRRTDIEVNGEIQPTLRKQWEEQGGFPGADIRGWVIDPVHLLPEDFESGDVRINIRMYEMGEGEELDTDISYTLN